MRPFLSASAIRHVEDVTQRQAPISALDLMERAGKRCAERILGVMEDPPFRQACGFAVLVGMGNNGGDGLVIARYLHQAGHQVRIFRVRHRAEVTSEHAEVLLKARMSGLDLINIDELSEAIQYTENEIVIDCIFGTGLASAPAGWIKELIVWLNASGRPVIAIDLPSGMLPLDVEGAFDPEACIRATCTLTFEVPRLMMVFPETGPFAGRWELLSIGLDPLALAEAPHQGLWVEQADIMRRLQRRPRFAHKGTFGHAGIWAGSVGFYGAAVLATKACLRSGAGLVTAFVPHELAPFLASVAPEAMSGGRLHTEGLAELPDLIRFTAFGVGPGLGAGTGRVKVLLHILRHFSGPLVLDADALNMLAGRTEVLHSTKALVLLTPHPKEMDRLLGSPSKNSYHRLVRTQAFAREFGCTVVLKGAYTAVCTADEQAYFNSTGNVGMAKGGSGDVLTGLLTGLLAQGYPPLEASLIAVYIHGLAGDMAARERGADAMCPTDLLGALPHAWQALRKD